MTFARKIFSRFFKGGRHVPPFPYPRPPRLWTCACLPSSRHRGKGGIRSPTVRVILLSGRRANKPRKTAQLSGVNRSPKSEPCKRLSAPRRLDYRFRESARSAACETSHSRKLTFVRRYNREPDTSATRHFGTNHTITASVPPATGGGENAPPSMVTSDRGDDDVTADTMTS